MTYLRYFKTIIVLLLFINCKNPFPYHHDPIPKHKTIKIKSKYVEETRVINIWTPPTYENSTKSFPVLYMPDGGIKEDFPHIANTLLKLINKKSIPPIILVGIENTVRRRDLTGYSETKDDEKYCPLTDGAKNFRTFIKEELIPKINQQYRTTSKKGIIGESLAGLFVMETFIQHPNTFDFYIAFDPSLWWNNHYLVRNVTHLFVKFPNKKIKLWFAGSSATDISIYTNKLNNILIKNAPNSLIWNYCDEPHEKHNTIFRATKEKALKWILSN